MMPKASLPPGFRFHPTDAELVCYYLKRKVMGKPLPFNIVAELELYKFAPWDLPDKSCLKSKDLKWYFFCSRDLKYANGSRTNRATDIGYWKTTGRDRIVFHRSRTVGMIKTLIFHEGKPPGGVRTDWVMYEYRLEDKELTDAGIPQGAFVLCKVFQKSGRGPKNGEQYGAPFNEEDWEDDTGIECSGSVSCMFSSPALLEDQAIMLEPGPPAPVVSGIGEVSSMPMPEGDDELWKVLFEALRESPHNLGGAQGETSSAPVLHSQIHAGDVLLEGMYDGLRDLPGCAELKQVGGNCTITESNEYNLQPECGPEFYVNVDDEQFLMDINPSELVIPDDLLAYDIFENLPAFQTMNDNGVSALPVDDAVPTAASITDSLPGANTYQNQCAPNVEINAHREDDNQQTDAELHQLAYPVWQPDYGANIYSTRGVGGSGSKKSFSYSDPSTSFCYPHR